MSGTRGLTRRVPKFRGDPSTLHRRCGTASCCGHKLPAYPTLATGQHLTGTCRYAARDKSRVAYLCIRAVMGAIDLLWAGAENTTEHSQEDTFRIERHHTRVAVAICHEDGSVRRVHRDIGRLVEFVAAGEKPRARVFSSRDTAQMAQGERMQTDREAAARGQVSA